MPVPQEVPLQNPTSDYDQPDWPVAASLDGKPETAWGIHPHEGKRHVAVYELKQPLNPEGAQTLLTFTLDQLHGRGHTIGRLRLSVTNAPHPVRATNLPEPIAQALATPRDQRTDQQRATLAAHVQLLNIETELAKLPPQHLVYAAASDFPPDQNFKPANGVRPIHVLKRGDITLEESPAIPGALSAVQSLPWQFPNLKDSQDESARRAALAKWISDPRNTLTWRSIANRVWHHHFGRGIVDTPSDFGRMGSRPTHPELLDYLATVLLDHNGSLKSLHRLIVTSATYRQSSQHNDVHAKIDADNRFLWRANRTRLDAESIRDAVLQVTGRLDLSMGGPSVKQFIESPGIHVTPNVDYLSFDADAPELRRRSVYRFLFRTLPDPFMETMDCADASQLTPVRSSSVTALQALSMLNNAFLVRHSEHLAARLEQMSADPRDQINHLYELTLCRPATEKEQAALAAYAAKHGLANACRLVLNSNEFMFVN